MSYIFGFHVPTAPVAESDQFSQVRRIHCRQEAKIVEADSGKDIFGYAVSFDMAPHDLETELCKTSRPRELGEVNHQSMTIGPIYPVALTSNIDDPGIWININCEKRQDNSMSKPICGVEETITDLFSYTELHPGDMIYMGTPPDVGAVVMGKLMTGGLEGMGKTWVQAGAANGS
jgi:fumarylpyruvate hydrolase